MNKLIYLAGAITQYERINQLPYAIIWRYEATEKLKEININIFDPTINYLQNKSYNSKSVPYQNLFYLEKADILLVNLEYLAFSPGTLWEIFIPWYNKKPVIAFGEETPLLKQPHIEEAITTRFNTLDEAIRYIKSMYIQ